MASVVKYMFDRDFDDLQILKDIVEQEALDVDDDAEAEAEAPPPAPTFSEEDVAAARRQGYERGKKEGVAEALAGIEQKIALALDKIGAQLDAMLKAQGEAKAATERDSAGLAIAIMRKLFPTLSAQHGTDEAVAVIQDVLANLVREPRISILVDEAAAEGVKARISAFLERRGFRGELAVHGESSLAPGDCRIEWMGGDAMRDAGALFNEIEAAIARHAGVTPSRPEQSQG